VSVANVSGNLLMVLRHNRACDTKNQAVLGWIVGWMYHLLVSQPIL
jgi:hypothetical protein